MSKFGKEMKKCHFLFIIHKKKERKYEGDKSTVATKLSHEKKKKKR
jgi:hypothetical protein